MDQPLWSLRTLLSRGIGRIWYQIVGRFTWNTMPETKSQKVYTKRNGIGLKI
jgi:hypothetical protein